MRRAAVALGLGVALSLGGPLAAQTATRDTVRERPALFERSDLWLLAGFTGATVAMFPLDRDIAGAVRDSSLVANARLNDAANAIGFLGSYGPFIIGGTLYAVGRLGDKPRLADLAVHTGEAMLAGTVLTGALKMALGRARPFATPDTNPRDFGLLRGFRGDRYQAFPSGHSTLAFSVAAAVTAEVNEWWPRSRWFVGSALYGGATLVGLSRMYEDKHWASDIALGAAIGTFAGIKTVRYNHARRGNRLDRLFLGGDALQLRVTPGPDGTLSLGVLRRW